MSERNKNNSQNAEESVNDSPDFRKLGEEGMSILTAQGAISRKLRKEIMEQYDIVELINKGRYIKAKAYGKDGQHIYELLIDKQTSDIQVVAQSRIR